MGGRPSRGCHPGNGAIPAPTRLDARELSDRGTRTEGFTALMSRSAGARRRGNGGPRLRLCTLVIGTGRSGREDPAGWAAPLQSAALVSGPPARLRSHRHQLPLAPIGWYRTLAPGARRIRGVFIGRTDGAPLRAETAVTRRPRSGTTVTLGEPRR